MWKTNYRKPELSVPKANPVLAEDSTEPVSLLLRLRLPWLLGGLVIGALLTLVVSRYESVLSRELSTAYFIPIILYLSSAVGNQTEAIFLRHIRKGKSDFKEYFAKELALGLILGVILGGILGLFSSIWVPDRVALSVALAMFASVSVATVLGLVVTAVIFKEHQDPAVGAGPFFAAIQDFVSILIYFFVAGLILL